MSLTTFSGPVKSNAGFIGPVAQSALTAASTLTAADSGNVYFLDSATEFATTLPAPAAGLSFTFIVNSTPSRANYTIVPAASATIIKGHAYPASGDAGDTGTADDTISFVSAAAVAGDMVTLISDGTSWFAKAFCAVAAGVTFTQAS